MARKKKSSVSRERASDARGARRRAEVSRAEQLELPHQVQRAGRLLKADVLSTPEVVRSQLVVLKFNKQKGSPDLVRITLDNSEEVLRPTQTEGVSAPRPTGTWVNAFIEIAGNPGDVARIAIANALPNAMEISVPSGLSSSAGIKPLLVTG